MVGNDNRFLFNGMKLFGCVGCVESRCLELK